MLGIKDKRSLMSTNQQKRITKQIRVEIELHKKLRTESFHMGITTSKLLDIICQEHFMRKDQERDKIN